MNPPIRLCGFASLGHCVLLLSLGSLAGCGGKDKDWRSTYPVTGKIMFEGQPLSKAEIWLVPKSEDSLNAKTTIRPYAKTESDGTFTLTTYLNGDGAPNGDYSIMVVWGARVNTDDGDEVAEVEKNKNSTRRPRFPNKYRDPTTSGLTYSVQQQPNQLDLDLKSK